MLRRCLPVLLFVGLTTWVVPPAHAVSGGVSGSTAEASDRAGDCQQSCPGDDSEGHCPPGCDECACCPGAVPAVGFAVPTLGAPPPVRAVAIETTRAAPSGRKTGVWRPPRARG